MSNLIDLKGVKLSRGVEGALRENAPLKDEMYESILNNLAEGVVVAGKNGQLLFFNPVATEILGIGLKSVDKEEWSSVYGTFYPDQKTPYPSHELPLARALKGELVDNDLIFVKNPKRPEGTTIEISARPIIEKNGTIIGSVVIFRDIKERLESEISRKKNEERIKTLFQGIPIPTYVWQKRDNDFVLLDYNKTAARFTEGKIEQLLGKKLSDIYESNPEILADIHRCFNEKTTITKEMEYSFRTVEKREELEVWYVFVPPDFIMVHTENVTERNYKDRELKKLSNAVDQTADTIFITNTQGIIEYVNPAFESITGYDKQEAIGKSPSILKSEFHNDDFFSHIWNTISDGNTFRGTIVNRKKNGQMFWSEQTITPIKDKDSEIINYVSVLKDITELKKRQEHEFHLNIARKVQQRLYNRAIANVPGFEISGATYPAVETGGDYFDFFPMKDGCLGIVIGDVSGHGIGSALTMTATRAYLRAFAKTESDPGLLLTWLNQELVSDTDGQFITMLLASLNPVQKTVKYSNAGHIPAHVLSESCHIKHTLESDGIPLGFIPDYQYSKSDVIQLAPSDMIVFLTDGIVEAHVGEGDHFGMQRTLEHIEKHRKESAQLMISNLYDAVRSYTGIQAQEDDITSIICKVDPEIRKD